MKASHALSPAPDYLNSLLHWRRLFQPIRFLDGNGGGPPGPVKQVSLKDATLKLGPTVKAEGFYHTTISADLPEAVMGSYSAADPPTLYALRFRVRYAARYKNRDHIINCVQSPGWVTQGGGRLKRKAHISFRPRPRYPWFQYVGPPQRFPSATGKLSAPRPCAFAFVIVSDEPFQPALLRTLHLDGIVLMDDYEAIRNSAG
ncbi:MAG: hypothetical protein AAF570_16295 [Bacteroidota bacterium]